MRLVKNQDSTYIYSIFNSLDVNRKLFCNYLKEYSNKKNTYLTNNTTFPTESEDSLILYMNELLMESLEDLRRVELSQNNKLNVHLIEDSINFGDKYTIWKNDLALRILILKNLKRMDSLDLQRAMFICLDSPYAN